MEGDRRDGGFGNPVLALCDPAEGLPRPGLTCFARARDAKGEYNLPWPVYYRDGHWFNITEDRKVVVKVIGWRYAPVAAQKENRA